MATTENIELSDELITSLQNQVNELSFIDNNYIKLKGYSCCACRNIAISHRTANCKDVFCIKCLPKFYKKPCPYCKTKVESDKRDLEFERAVLELKVSCKFIKNGCEENVSLRDYLNHIDSCKFKPENLLPIVYKGDTARESVDQTDDVHQIKQSLELLKSEFMKQKNEQDITIKNLEEKVSGMMQKLVTIEDMQIEMKSLKNLMQEKDKTFKKLQNKSFNQKLVIEKIQTGHTGEIQNFETQQQKLLKELKTELTVSQNFRKDSSDYETPGIYLWKVPEIQKNLQAFLGKDPVIFRSETPFVTPNGFKFRPQLYTSAKRDYINIALEFETERDNINCSDTYLHSRRYVMLDQSAAFIKDNVERIDRPEFKMNYSKDMMRNFFVATYFFPISLLKGENKYIKDDQILIKIILEPIAYLWKQVISNDGKLSWRIKDYSKSKEKYDLISKPFKTRNVGYTMQVEINLNGMSNGKGKYISVYLRVILGEHDEFLSLPSNLKLNFCLLDQSDSLTKNNVSNEKHFELTQGLLKWGCPLFVLQSTAEDPKYLKNDSLLLQTTVQFLL